MLTLRLAGLMLLSAWAGFLWAALDRADAERRAAAPTIVEDLAFDDFVQRHLMAMIPAADGFDWPLRPPHGEGVKITQPFLFENSDGMRHLGENWNTAPGNDDLGEPVHAIADGWVLMAADFSPPWGKVVSIVSRLPDSRWPVVIETIYAHLETIDVPPLSFVKRGQKIGALGNADGYFKAHLYWEIRTITGLGLGPDYATDTTPWLNPRGFISGNRPAHTPTGLVNGQMEELPPETWDHWGGDLSDSDLPR
jgi:murein DD-endopeptidase MepM/ murein hydrolase activator NlpD